MAFSAHRHVAAAVLLALWASVLLYATRGRWPQRPRRSDAPPPRQTPTLLTAPPSLSKWEPLLGRYGFNVTTRIPEAQALFQLGLQLLYNFDQPNARAAFMSAQEADRTCAMCSWGVAHSYGPFLNHPTRSAEDLALARAAACNASALLDGRRQLHSVKEQVLIGAIAVRYADDPARQRIGYSQYASKLRALRQSSPGALADPDLMVFDAESRMQLMVDDDGYHFYESRGDDLPPVEMPGTGEVLVLLREALLLTNQTHPYAQHLLIHGTETSNVEAESAVSVARQLFRDMTQAGLQDQHLQHMGSHAFFRTGHYHEALLTNTAAVNSDHAYLSHGLVPFGGPGHDAAFAVASALWGGQRQLAYKYASVLQDVFRRAPERPDSPGPSQAWAVPMAVALRFGDWESVSQLDAAPPEGFSTAWPYGAGVLRSFALSVASARLGQRAEAEEHLEQLRNLSGEMAAAGHAVLTNLSAIAGFTAEAVLSSAAGDTAAAADAMQRAADVEMGMRYQEPPPWLLPSRECLGKALLNAGQAREAEGVFRQALYGFSFHAERRCGWALFGLRASLEQQRRDLSKPDVDPEIANLTAQIEEVWQQADVPLTSACLMLEES